MAAPSVSVLRVTGLPREMALRAIDTVLASDRCVIAIDAVDPGAGDPHAYAVHVIAEEAGAERIRRKLETSFTLVDVEDVTDTGAAACAPSLRVRAGTVGSLPPSVTLETRRMRRGQARLTREQLS